MSDLRVIKQLQIDLDKPTQDNYETVWRYQVHGLNVQGLACVADEDAVYMGGSTESDLWENWENSVAGGDHGKELQPTLSPDAFVTKVALGPHDGMSSGLPGYIPPGMVAVR